MGNKINTNTISAYSGEFSESSFWKKLLKYATKAGRKLITMALELYYAYRDGNLSTSEKATVIAALGYFICPIDLIPDAIPVLGFTDDLTALKIAYELVSREITPEIKAKAKRKVEDLLD